jgi:threonine dehydratase
MNNLTFSGITLAHSRIKPHIKNTPVISDLNLNEELHAQVFFKMENQQEAKSFKARGAFNAVLSYKEKHGKFPEKVVVQSSGNHAQAIAYVCKKFGIKALIYMVKKSSSLKIAAARNLGAEVVLLDKRSEVNRLAEEKQKEGYFFIHPSADGDVIYGQGTAALEALNKIGKVDAIFVPCGGGGLAAGTFLAAKKLSPNAKIYACEPASANDVAISLRDDKIFHFKEAPNTIADGARTLATSEICFQYLRQLDGLLEISEEEIEFWRQKLEKTFKQKIEPTSALAAAGASRFLEEYSDAEGQKLLVIISGGNVD